MSTNPKTFNYGLPNRYPKLPRKLTSKVKSTFSKYASKSWDLCNPDPIPFQRDAFKPSTISKIIDIPKRFIDGFMSHDDMDSQPQRGIILHTERYVWSSMKEIYKSGSQNDRLLAEENFLKKAKYMKKLSESRLKIQNQNLILEGENLLSSVQLENFRPDPHNVSINSHKGRSAFASMNVHSGSLPPAPTMIDSIQLTERDLELEDNSKPVSMAVQKIKLKNRMPGSETLSSAPIQGDQRNQNNLNTFFHNINTKSSNDKLPPIQGNQKDFEPHGRQSDASFDYESSYRQSERINRPNIRINEYIMDGISMKFTERADIQGEIRFLKSIILPSIARELYVGRGIQLPPNHATKVPRGKYVQNDSIKKVAKSSDLIIETPGGGNVTIHSTNTPVDINTAEEKSPRVSVDGTNEDSQSTQNNPNDQKELMEQIIASVTMDGEGFMKASTLNEVFNEYSKSLPFWKIFFSTILLSVDKINMEQLLFVLKAENLSGKFPETFPVFETEEAKQIIPTIFDMFPLHDDLIKTDEIINLLKDKNQLTISLEQIDETYDIFIQQMNEEKSFENGNIHKLHLLLFLPFLLRKLRN